MRRPGAGMAPADEVEVARQEAIAIRHQFALLKQEVALAIEKLEVIDAVRAQELAAARADAERLGLELEAMRATKGWRALEQARAVRRRLQGRSAD